MAILIGMDISVRKVPEDLWRQVRIVAATKGVTIRELLLTAIREYLEREARRAKD